VSGSGTIRDITRASIPRGRVMSRAGRLATIATSEIGAATPPSGRDDVRRDEEAQMTSGERVSGTPDEQYDVVSVLYHALQGGETSEQYIDDARKAGDEELVSFFEKVQAEDRDRADHAKRLLGGRLQVAAR
jgi:hypothetical protein